MRNLSLADLQLRPYRLLTFNLDSLPVLYTFNGDALNQPILWLKHEHFDLTNYIDIVNQTNMHRLKTLVANNNGKFLNKKDWRFYKRFLDDFDKASYTIQKLDLIITLYRLIPWAHYGRFIRPHKSIEEGIKIGRRVVIH